MARFTLAFIALFLFAASIFSVLDYSYSKEKSKNRDESSLDLVSCKVKMIYDGDTIGCDFDGNGKVDNSTEHVRLLGIDAPEMHYSKKNKTGKDEPLAVEATELVKRTVIERTVYLEFDQERYDRYNRTLAYLYLDPDRKSMLNRILLEKGLARVLFLNSNRRYEEDFNRLIQDRNHGKSSITNTTTPLARTRAFSV